MEVRQYNETGQSAERTFALPFHSPGIPPNLHCSHNVLMGGVIFFI